MKHGCNIIMDSMNGEQIQTQETKSEDDTETPSKNEDAYLVWMARNSAAAA